MFNTIRNKLLFGIISSVVIINIVFSIFIYFSLDSTFKNDIIREMIRLKNISLYTIKQNEIMEEPLWKSLASIKDISNSYVALASKEKTILQFTGELIDEYDIDTILEESKNLKSTIKFKKINKAYGVTYNYPIYLSDKFYGNLIIQKDYIEKYNEKLSLISLIIIGQVFVAISIITVVLLIVKKVTDPIKKLSNSMENFMNNKNEEDVVINSNDEVGNLAKSYNLMKNDLKNQMNIIIKEKNKVEDLQKSSREFFNNATHELKTPITAISLYAQILKDDDIKSLDEEFIYRATNRIVLESEKMKALVEKILEVSKGEISINKAKSKFSLTDLVEEIIEDFKVRIEEKKLIINRDIKKVDCYAILDDIEIIICNLLDNSIKYCKTNEIKLKIYEDHINVNFEISNKCIDFPKEIRDKLLEPFVKYNFYKDISSEVSSSGLGLHLCNKLSSKNDGELEYKISKNYITFKLKIKKIN